MPADERSDTPGTDPGGTGRRGAYGVSRALHLVLPTALLSLKMLGWDLDSPVARAWVTQHEVAGA